MLVRFCSCLSHQWVVAHAEAITLSGINDSSNRKSLLSVLSAKRGFLCCLKTFDASPAINSLERPLPPRPPVAAIGRGTFKFSTRSVFTYEGAAAPSSSTSRGAFFAPNTFRSDRRDV